MPHAGSHKHKGNSSERPREGRSARAERAEPVGRQQRPPDAPPDLPDVALAAGDLRPLPEIKAQRAGSSRRSRSASREGRRRQRLKQRLAIGGLVVLIGASLGVLAAWWAGSSDAPDNPEAVAAPPTAPALPATTGTPVPTPAAVAALPPAPVPVPPSADSRAGVPQKDVAEMLRERSTSGWQLARLRGNPAVIVLEFPNLAEQGAAMNRIAALVEKAGAPRDRVLSDTELHQLIVGVGDNAQTFYQGHDYVAEQIARFFTLAEKQGQAMNVHETKLRQLLLEKKVLAQEGRAYVAQGLQAIVTFTAPQPDDPGTPQDEKVDERRRESVLLHELSHGLYFTSREYREHCWRFWRSRLSDEERRLFRVLLARMNYDPANEDLLVNEMQALLMHTPDTRAFAAPVLGVSKGQLDDLRARFRKGMPTR